MEFIEIKSISDIPLESSINKEEYIIFIDNGEVIGCDSWTIYEEYGFVKVYDSNGSGINVYFKENNSHMKCFMVKCN